MFSSNKKGYWLLVLHAHIPFVRHPEYNDSIEERWLYEAVLESYIPLLEMLDRLIDEGVKFKFTLSITPTLASMLEDSFLENRILRHMEKLIELAEKEVYRTIKDPTFNQLALMYYNRFLWAHKVYTEKYKKNLLKGFKKFQDLGVIEIIASSAAHCFLPLYEAFPSGIRAQISTGVNEYERHFGRSPLGMWNAECGYFPSLENYLEEYKIKYFFVDTHGLLNSSPPPIYGVFAPLMTENGIAYFGRDIETSRMVWSAKEGYPGDPYYREFYRDIGYDLDYEYIKPYIHESGNRIFTGVKYYRVTDKNGSLEDKKPYEILRAQERVREHSLHFVNSRERQIGYLSNLMDRKPVVVSMYDAELFGHWWFEGIDFLYNVIKAISKSNIVEMITPSEYLQIYPENQVSSPPMSSWGNNGYNEFWLNESNDWIYRHIHKSIEMMRFLANRFENETSPNIIRCLNQAAREVLLSMASDWPFIMKTKTMDDYAKRRILESIDIFNKLFKMCLDRNIEMDWLSRIEASHRIFPEIDFKIFRHKG